MPEKLISKMSVDACPLTSWPFSETGHTDEAKKEMLAIFDGKATFDTPKPHRLIEFVLKVAGTQDALILDSFAGSGTTAHAVLNMNKADGGHRKFILVEMGDYADTITAERVKRVIMGYGEGQERRGGGTGGSFSYYELGEPRLLLPNGNLNEKVGTVKIRDLHLVYRNQKSRCLTTRTATPISLARTTAPPTTSSMNPRRSVC